ncbi:MAG: efflux transporter periplasmic adaptor subunit, partial [Bacteroidaceae bacterium]|nr:efflux transporter periplasmic adaptor subunit [Bacteroidaceae bacterium]
MRNKRLQHSVLFLLATCMMVACADGQKKQSGGPVGGEKPKVRLAAVNKRAVDQVRDYTCTVEAEVKN